MGSFVPQSISPQSPNVVSAQNTVQPQFTILELLAQILKGQPQQPTQARPNPELESMVNKAQAQPINLGKRDY